MSAVIREYRSLSEALPAYARHEVWLPYQVVTLALLPEGYTSAVWQRCPRLFVEKEYVQLTRREPGEA